MKEVTGGKWFFLLGKGWMYSVPPTTETPTGKVLIDGKEYKVTGVERGQDLRIGKNVAVVIEGTPKLWS